MHAMQYFRLYEAMVTASFGLSVVLQLASGLTDSTNLMKLSLIQIWVNKAQIQKYPNL